MVGEKQTANKPDNHLSPNHVFVVRCPGSWISSSFFQPTKLPTKLPFSVVPLRSDKEASALPKFHCKENYGVNNNVGRESLWWQQQQQQSWYYIYYMDTVLLRLRSKNMAHPSCHSAIYLEGGKGLLFNPRVGPRSPILSLVWWKSDRASLTPLPFCRSSAGPWKLCLHSLYCSPCQRSWRCLLLHIDIHKNSFRVHKKALEYPKHTSPTDKL